jgi:diaminohydroxyphosphoribosylaminopyrimidine deaminase/5-amino-6-(5-phosphoribosylamino)uracil reductase
MTGFTATDRSMMNRAIQLAKNGRFTTSPNPNVGCVIAVEGEIVGEGFHYRAGEGHAEVHALAMAKDKAMGATAYVTLEPCSHYGRTPPCAQGLIDAKVARVICAMSDPNPQVAGRGFDMLRAAGIEVQVGLMEPQARELNPGFLKKMETGLPFVQLKMASSLDGQTALANGKSQWITGPQARADVQAFRAQSCAILSTSQTVIEDNASLNVRYGELPKWVQEQVSEQQLRQPKRVVLDRQNKLSPDLRLYHGEGQVIRVSTRNADVVVPELAGRSLCLATTLRTLAEKQNINHVWVEAGATLAAGFFKDKLVDELVLYLAPKLMGADGRGLISALGLSNMEDVIDLSIKDMRMVGNDIRIIATPVYK